MHVELVTSNAGSTTSANLDQNLPTNSSWRCTAAVVIAALGALQAGFSVAMTSPIAPQVISQTDIDLDQWSTIVAVLQLGGALGSLIEGMLAYKIGSLNLMTLSNFPVIIGYLLMLSFENFSCFLVSRILIGVGNGIALATATLFIAEISPQNKRGYLGSFVQLAISSGIFLAYLAGFGVLYFDKYYRAMFWIGAALALVSSVLLRFLKESPRHYIRKENHERARESLIFYRSLGWEIESEFAGMLLLDSIEASYSSILSSLKDSRILFLLFITSAMHIFKQFSGITVIYSYASAILETSSTTIAGLIGACFISALQLIVILIFSPMFDWRSRRSILIIAFFLQAVSLLCLAGFGIYVHEIGRLIFLGIFVIAFASGPGPILWILSAELLPKSIRSFGISIAVFANWMTAFCVLETYASIQSALGQDNVFYVYGGLTVFGAFFLYFLLPETSSSQSLEEFENNLMNRERSILPKTVFSSS